MLHWLYANTIPFYRRDFSSKGFFYGVGEVLDPILHAYEEQFYATGRITDVLYKELTWRDNRESQKSACLFPREKHTPLLSYYWVKMDVF